MPNINLNTHLQNHFIILKYPCIVSYTKAQLSKNTNEIILSKYHIMNTQNLIKMMSLTVSYHGPSTTFHIW